ncbi:M13 family metallopeptidase [Streptacidiphilus pinicola]|uniref:M13 family metallopeptidase n=1 Tax=Streptacidiphilus pinicola TaxID=2219663 RepID=UPI001403A652|nr:M13 family metallopeptidase [Streptacidiphilus pinicola]
MPTTRPQDDLYAHVNGEWAAQSPLGSRRSLVTTFTTLQLAADAAVRELLDQDGDVPDVVAKARAFRRSWLDGDAAATEDELRRLLARTADIHDPEDFFRWSGEVHRLGVITPLQHYVDIAAGEERRYAGHVLAATLPLPLDHYRDPAAIEAYRADLAEMLAAVGAEADVAPDLVTLESRLAELHRAAAPRTGAAVPCAAAALPAELPALALFLDGAGIVPAEDGLVHVERPELLHVLTEQLAGCSATTLRGYARWCVLTSLAPYAPPPVSTVWARLNRRAGTQPWLRRDRAGQGEFLLSRAFGHALGHAYATAHVDAETRAEAWDVVRRVLAAYRATLLDCSWLGPRARAAALDKLDRMHVAFVAPERPRDYGGVEIHDDRLLANYRALCAHEIDRELRLTGTPVSADHWRITPSQVNAHYDARANRIVIPAAALQPPLFRVGRLAACLGGLGAVVAHELTHAFDEFRIGTTADGLPEPAWGPAEESVRAERNAALVRQFGGFRRTDHPDLRVDGNRTLCENIADLAGLAVAVRAWDDYGARHAEPDDDAHRAGTRELFLGWARLWRQAMTRPVASVLSRDAPHAPGEARCNQIARNLDAFHTAFGTGPDDAMWCAPADRVLVW